MKLTDTALSLLLGEVDHSPMADAPLSGVLDAMPPRAHPLAAQVLLECAIYVRHWPDRYRSEGIALVDMVLDELAHVGLA